MIHLRPRIDRLSPETEEGIAARLAHQWAVGRDVRRAQPAPVTGGTSNFSRAQVPWGVDLAAAWSWRFLGVAAPGRGVFPPIGAVSVVVLPGRLPPLLTAPGVPPLHRLGRGGGARGPAPPPGLR